VTLYAKGDVGAKLITVVEIAKREVAGKGGKWFQYSCVEGKVEEVKKRKEKKGGGQSDQKKNGDGGEDGEEEGFEVMKTPFERAIEGRPKVREVPVLIVYLSRVRIEILRKKYGYVMLSPLWEQFYNYCSTNIGVENKRMLSLSDEQREHACICKNLGD